MTTTITLIPGDGIGPEVTAATLRILDVAGAELDYDQQLAGSEALARHGTALPDSVLDSVLEHRVALKGPVTTPVGKGFRSINVQIRQKLDLFANLRPVFSVPGLPSRYEGVDIVVVRENTEGLYTGIEHEVVPGVVESLKIITEKASTRIARFAFEYCRREGRKRVTVAHKANIMKLTDGLFLDCFHAQEKEYPEIEADDRIIDALCMQLVLFPERFDVLLLENLYGDIVSDLCAGLVGGLGVVGGANLGVDCAVFEAVHGSAPDIAGQNRANPVALLRSAMLMLDHLGKREIAANFVRAVRKVMVEQKILTGDLGGTASTTELTEAIVRALE